MRLWSILLLAASACAQDSLPPWTPGVLDIHQIQTGRGNAAFIVFPDGMTLLLDAGAVPDRPGLELGPARPDASRTPGEWIARYITRFAPHQPPSLDYALMTHHHDDHISALPEVAARIPIRTLLDRGLDPAPPPFPAVQSYLDFRARFSGSVEVAEAGRRIAAGGAEIRILAGNGRVWTGDGVEPRFPPDWRKLPKAEQPSENECSIALRLRHGRFSYYTGGDLPGIVLDGLPAWHDLETPVAQAAGPVDVAVLDHHGWLDSTNEAFLHTLDPRVVVIPAWHASHPDHGVMRRLRSPQWKPAPPDIYLTSLLEAPKAIFGYLRDAFRSTEGHIVVRVEPGGERYRVFVLDDTRESWAVRSVREYTAR